MSLAGFTAKELILLMLTASVSGSIVFAVISSCAALLIHGKVVTPPAFGEHIEAIFTGIIGFISGAVGVGSRSISK